MNQKQPWTVFDCPYHLRSQGFPESHLRMEKVFLVAGSVFRRGIFVGAKRFSAVKDKSMACNWGEFCVWFIRFSLVFSFLLGFSLLVGWYFTTEGQLFGLSSIDMSYFSYSLMGEDCLWDVFKECQTFCGVAWYTFPRKSKHWNPFVDMDFITLWWPLR